MILFNSYLQKIKIYTKWVVAVGPISFGIELNGTHLKDKVLIISPKSFLININKLKFIKNVKLEKS